MTRGRRKLGLSISILSTRTRISTSRNTNNIEFEILGNNHELWAEQFKNDLENLYINESLVFIGGFNKAGSQSEFEFTMYKTLDRVNKTHKFDLEIDTIYGNLMENEVENYLNSKYENDRLIYVGSFVINRKFWLNDIYDESNFQMRLIVFQNLNINYLEYDEPFKFIVKSFPKFCKKTEKEMKLMKTIDLYEETNKCEFLGVLPGHSTEDSFLIYWDWKEPN